MRNSNIISNNLTQIIVQELETDLRKHAPIVRIRKDTTDRIDIDIVIRNGTIKMIRDSVINYQRQLNNKYKHLGVYITFSLIQG